MVFILYSSNRKEGAGKPPKYKKNKRSDIRGQNAVFKWPAKGASHKGTEDLRSLNFSSLVLQV